MSLPAGHAHREAISTSRPISPTNTPILPETNFVCLNLFRQKEKKKRPPNFISDKNWLNDIAVYNYRIQIEFAIRSKQNSVRLVYSHFLCLYIWPIYIYNVYIYGGGDRAQLVMALGW